MCLELAEQCRQCAHSEFFNYDYRCSKYHDSLCIKVYDFCNGEYFIHKEHGLSLYALKSWINNLSSEELKLPLVVEEDNKLFIPLAAIKTYNDLHHEYWRLYMKRDDKNE